MLKPVFWLALMLFGIHFGAQAEAIGGYAAGCQTQSRALPLSGEGFQVVRAERQRYYGQPELIDYLQGLGQRLNAAGLPPMLVAD